MLSYRRLLGIVFAVVVIISVGGVVVLLANGSAPDDALPASPTAAALSALTPTLSLPTITDTPTATVTPSSSPTFLIATVAPTATATAEALVIVAAVPTSTDAQAVAMAAPTDATATLTPLPLVVASVPEDFRTHFLMARPFSQEYNTAEGYSNWASRNYPYGSTASGQYQVHHGVDIMNPTSVPVRTVAAGTVFYAGDDLSQMFGPSLNFYGNLVIVEHDITAPDGSKVYSLYGHLSEVHADTGDEVPLYWQIGLVGSTGVAYGSHLHFEVRVGDPYDYFATRNPDLWLQNFRDFGVLAGRVVDASGQPAVEQRIEIRSANLEAPRVFTTYADLNLPGDDVLHENFAIGDLPEGEYEVIVEYPGGTLRETITVYADRVNWLTFTLP